MKPMEGARAAFRLLGKAVLILLRGIGWLFLIAVLLAGGIGAYVYRRFSPEDARRLAQEQLTALLHREVTIEHLVLSPRGLKATGLRVRRGTGAGEEDLLVCDSAVVTVKLRPLLDKRLELDTVVLQSPQVFLTRDEQGSWNLADIFGSTSSTTAPSPLPVALAAAETVVKDGVLRVDDRLRGRKLSLEKWSLRVDGFDLDRAFPVETSFATTDSFAGRTVTASVSAEGRIDLAGMQWSSATATASRLHIEIGGVVLTGRVDVAGFTAPHVEMDVASPALGPQQWKSLLDVETDFSLPSARWRLKTDIPAAGMLDVDKLTVETSAGSASATGLVDLAGEDPTLSIEVSARDLDLARMGTLAPAMAKHALSGKATLRASITGWPGRLQARDAELALRGFGGTWGDRRIEDADIDATAAEEFSRLSVSATKGKVFAVGETFDEIALALTVEKQNLVLERLALRWGGTRLKLRARVQELSAPKEVVLSGSADRVDWDATARLVSEIRAAISTATTIGATEGESRPWLRTFKYAIPHGFPDTTGHLRVGEVTHPNFNCRDVELMWTVRGVTPALDRVNGEARLSFGPGRVSDISAVQDANKFLRVVFIPFIYMYKMNQLSIFSTATAYPKSIDFAKIDGEYGASRGVVTTRYFHVDSNQLAAYAEGTADFAREQVDMNMLTRLGSYNGTLPEWWVDEKGRPAIGFRVKGDINKPELEPRFKKIGEGEIEQKVDEGRARAKKRFEALEKLQTL